MEGAFEETWFYAPLADTGGKALLPEEESNHLLKVLRVRPGRRIVVTNGEGGVFLCDTRPAGKGLEVEAVEVLRREPNPPRLHLVLGLLKGRDSEEPVEGVCQLAVAGIHLVTTDHTQEFKGQDHARLLERLRHKSLVALKQAKKSWLTEVHAPVTLREWRRSHPGPLVVAHPGPDRLPEKGTGPLYVLVGPEGGFSGEETEWLFGAEGAFNLGLGGTRIRGTHAPLVACGKLMGLGLCG
ncbi:MAG TPA: RsmE family RNA methyltransferase [Fibrobacteria bacterium]|nr:RsmE family RNA methyltransferase [Fibrobacteria bacterium]